jgi:hypothetical protein
VPKSERTRIPLTPPLIGSPTLRTFFLSSHSTYFLPLPSWQIALHELEGRQAICEHNDRFGEKLREQRKLEESGWCKVVWCGRCAGGGGARLWTVSLHASVFPFTLCHGGIYFCEGMRVHIQTHTTFPYHSLLP